MEGSLTIKREIQRYRQEHFSAMEDEIVVEFPLTIMINGEEFATMVCSPYHLEELVIGFLASEGVIRFRKDIKDMKIDASQGFAHIQLHQEKIISQQTFSKRFIGSCCGKSRQFYFQNDVRTAKTSTSKTKLTAQQCINLMTTMQEESTVFKQTGGVHNAALCTSEDLIVSRTDIGRHNALDKLFGYSLLNQIPIRDKVLVFSGRISSEILTKAAKIGVGIVLSKSAPTDLAIQLANDLNITAVGFIRNGSFNVYSHPERIIE
ncbi:formate dehydrogenase accessory sulfurtransferase FdhD [Alkalihalobacillus pseudalcaliphilus]|uniref:formate dehydrogenase accessory sulfurtransferase FdhD n=1 Tax=Alkalihalobacillus pseudalcaliphilus TaxID=79884 RepID=UPI00064E0650|nr:formate dehydrogenase accessory sulfurtransferase FdhD [Alkalihalobacillus pseudalcaliphilus]KMK76953.1 formate dehydrogenase [Alkalihalobacillus pseudalcaliphilus]